MKKTIARFLLRLSGWKVNATIPDVPKCVICVAPHTSNWDFFLGKLAYMSLGREAGFLIKKDWFFFPFDIILNSMGGISVDRTKKCDLIDQLVEKFEISERFTIAITPEGTRKLSENWKSGFYYIALRANVPISLAYLDYRKKEIGITQQFIPSGDYENDLKKIKSYYSQFTAKNPAYFRAKQ